MGTHHILKDGTSYAINGGTGLIAGTNYKIGGVELWWMGQRMRLGLQKILPLKLLENFINQIWGTKEE